MIRTASGAGNCPQTVANCSACRLFSGLYFQNPGDSVAVVAAPLIFDHAGDFMKTVLDLGVEEESDSDSYDCPENHISSSCRVPSGILDF